MDYMQAKAHMHYGKNRKPKNFDRKWNLPRHIYLLPVACVTTPSLVTFMTTSTRSSD